MLGRLSNTSWGIALAALAVAALVVTVVDWRYVWSLAVRVRRGEFDADGLDDVDILGAPPVSGDDPVELVAGILKGNYPLAETIVLALVDADYIDQLV